MRQAPGAEAGIPIGEIPIAEHIINQFIPYGCDEIHLIVNHKKNMLKAYFNEFAQKALQFEIKDWIIDPGFGFAKTVEQNYQILNDLDVIADKVSGTPRILVGVSRKSMIYKPLDLQPDDVLPATQAVHMAALMKGADILRVHDVKEARQTVRLYQFL